MGHRIAKAEWLAVLVMGLCCSALFVSIPSAAQQNSRRRLFPVWEERRCGYIDKTGRLAINFQFEQCLEFSEGLALVRVGGRTAFINMAGRIAINPMFPAFAIEGFSDGFAKISSENRKWGYIDKSGAVVVAPIFDNARNFSEGMAAVLVRDKWGFIDKKGNLVIAPQFLDAEKFSQGLAAVEIYRNGERETNYIDRTGKIILNNQLDLIGGEPFSENLAAVLVGSRWGYIDRQGKFVIAPQFDGAGFFSQGLAVVAVGKKYGYINQAGQFVINPQFDSARSFSEGLACVVVDKKIGYIDKTGRYVIKPQFLAQGVLNPALVERLDFADGVAAVPSGNGALYINKLGKTIWTHH